MELKLKSALTELLESGVPFSDVAIQQIADQAKVSRPAFYTHFADKNELLVSVGLDVLWPSIEIIENPARWPSGPEHLPTAMAASLRYVQPIRPIVRAILEASHYQPDVAEGFHEFTMGFQHALAERIRDQQATGNALSGDPDELASALATFNTEMLRRYTSPSDPMDESKWVEIVSLVWCRVIYGKEPGIKVSAAE
ncbi:TetR/AcrR family transcriptional regulator [Nocardia sp. NPDC006630]|uniref:TetR/AcrR family transcriptional regulator n=1 Tax=Nocardia sp. NPDC006630 TaxID=3157181 RepID=UPI0033B534B7